MRNRNITEIYCMQIYIIKKMQVAKYLPILIFLIVQKLKYFFSLHYLLKDN